MKAFLPAQRPSVFIAGLVGLLAMVTSLDDIRLLAQEPKPKPATADGVTPVQEEKLNQERKPADQEDAGLDVFDDFFGKATKKVKEPDSPEGKDDAAGDDKKNEKKENADAVDVIVGPAVIAPAMRVAPALRVAPAMRAEVAIAVDQAEPLDGEDVDLDPKVGKLVRALKLERALLRRACVLTQEQEQTLDAWDAKWIQTQMKSEVGKKAIRKLSFIPMGLPDVPFSQFRGVLSELIMPELQKVLSEEQFAAFKTELDARSAFEKQTQIDATVAIVDHHLMLNSAQRIEVEKVVAKMGSLPQEPLNYLRYGQYIPSMSFAPVLKHLNKYQRKILQSLQQVTFGSSNEEDVDIIEK